MTLRSLSAKLGTGQLSGSAVMRRDGDRWLDFTLRQASSPCDSCPGRAACLLTSVARSLASCDCWERPRSCNPVSMGIWRR